MSKKFLTISIASLSALAIVWGVFVAFDWVEEYVATKQSPAYESLPFEFKLKTNPEEVIFSEAYTTEDGQDIVKYAYVAGEVGPQLNEDISRRTTESYTEIINTFTSEDGRPMETLKTTFLSKPQFYQDDGVWRQIEYATTTPEIFSMSGAIPYIKKRELVERLTPGKSVFALTSTFYPDPNTETTSVDGQTTQTWNDGDEVSAFSGAVGGAGSVADDSSTTATVQSRSQEIIPGDSYTATVRRGIILFDTSTLGSTAQVTAATLAIYVTGKINGANDGADTINVYSSNPASNTALVAGDFDSVGSTAFATAVDITTLSTSATHTFTLNSSGRGAIAPTGISKFSIREGHDIAGSSPGIAQEAVTFTTAEQTGTSQDPMLEVTYILGAFSFGQWFPF